MSKVSVSGWQFGRQCVPLLGFLQLYGGFFVIPFENIQPVIFRLYLLIPLEEGLL